MANNMIKCRFCAWQTTKYNKKGRYTGPQRLEQHVMDSHETELFAIYGVTSWETLAAIDHCFEVLDDYAEDIHKETLR